MDEKCIFQQFPPISRIVDDFCEMRCANLYKKPNTRQLVASFVSLEMKKNEVQAQFFSIVSS